MNEVKRFTLAHGVALSLILHGCLALPLLAWMMHTPSRYRSNINRLNVEIFGMLSNRQAAAQQKRIEKGRPGAPSPEQSLQKAPKPEIARREVATDSSSVQSETIIDMPDAVQLPLASSSSTENSSGSGSGSESRGGGDSGQRQLFIGHRNTDADLISAYVAQLTKQVNAHLIYPNEVKKKGFEGIAWISFVVTASGELKPNTLTIKKSSGYAALDANALKTITAIAPFQRPPHELTISLGIDFAVDR